MQIHMQYALSDELNFILVLTEDYYTALGYAFCGYCQDQRNKIRLETLFPDNISITITANLE